MRFLGCSDLDSGNCTASCGGKVVTSSNTLYIIRNERHSELIERVYQAEVNRESKKSGDLQKLLIGHSALGVKGRKVPRSQHRASS